MARVHRLPGGAERVSRVSNGELGGRHPARGVSRHVHAHAAGRETAVPYVVTPSGATVKRDASARRRFGSPRAAIDWYHGFDGD